MLETAETLRQAIPYFFVAELPEFKRIIGMLPPNPIVLNIGSGGGVSGLSVMETRPDSYLITVDITDLSSPFGCLEAERAALQRAGLYKQVRWHPHYNALTHRNFQVHMDSKELAKLWATSKNPLGKDFQEVLFDLIYVDGQHDFIGASGDINGWLPHIKAGGYMSVHDYCKQDISEERKKDGPHPKPWPDVDRAVNELLVGKHKKVGHVDSLITFLIS